MDRWLKRKSNNEGEPAPKKTVQEIPSTEGSEGGGVGGRAGGSADSSDAVNETDPPDFQKGSATERNVSKQPKDKFQANWLRLYPWLENNNGEMNCSICKMYGAVPFASRCYKTSTLRRHADGVSHTAAIKRKREADSAKSVMTKAIEDAHLQSAAEMKGLLKTAYFIAKNEMAKAKFCHVVKFLKEMECPAFKKLTETSSYGSYINEKGLSEMQQAIASTLVEDIDKAVERSPVFSLILDESTDISNTKRLIIYVRFIDDNNVKTKLIRNSEIADGRADTIVEDVKQLLTEKKLDGKKLAAVCTDGAAVMTGCRQGVIKKLRELYNPDLVGIHCTAHRLALAASDAANSVPQVKRFQQDLRSIFIFFSNSAVRSNKLHELQKQLDEPQLKFTQPHAVRWLSIHNAVSVVCRSLKSLRDVLEHMASSNAQDADKAKGLLLAVRQFNFVALCHMMKDVLMHVVLLSKHFQREDLDFSTAQPMVESTKEALKEIIVHPGPAETEFFSSLDGNKFKGDKIFDCHTQKPAFDDMKSRYVGSLITEIERRFPCETLDVLSWFTILEPKKAIMAKKSDNFSHYGLEKLDNLLAHFSNYVSAVDGRSEFALLKQTMVSSDSYASLTFQQFAEAVLSDHRGVFTEMEKLIKIALVIPIASVSCERGFSTQNRIKTRFRNSLNNANLTNLMLISELGPPKEQFDFNRAFIKWKEMKQRRQKTERTEDQAERGRTPLQN
ncbi:zinc finger protein 862-like [Nothobranchius furzeri]|uniref:Zinc finger protein 862-like n=2 Tax=Nothobranchius furzeri TaxID=105023 RepID=A0A9D3BR35_NOTFU|nr:zinc finger protein 862-like [Nothobranchius furzeri]